MICSKTILVGCIFLLAPFLAIGKKNQSPGELIPMVLVETRSPRSLSETSPWVTVLSGEDLERRQIHSVADALRTVPGMAVVRSGQAGAQVSLHSRGSESNHVTFLLEGRKLNGGFSGLYNLGQLSLTGLSGVEVLRGSSSTLYGAEGIGGAVMLRSGQVPENGVLSNVGLSGGSFGTLRGNLQTTFREGDWNGNIGLSGTTTENDRPNAGYWNHSTALRLEKTLSEEWSIDFLSMGYRTDLGLPNATYSPSVKDYQDTQNFLLSPGLIGKGNDWRFRGFYSFSKDDLESFSSSSWGDWETRSLTEQEEVEIQLDWEFDESWSVSAGSSFSTQRFMQEGSSILKDKWEKVSVFGLLRFSIDSSFELSGGFRSEDYSDFGSPTTWTVFSRQDLSDSLSLFGRFSTSFCPPTGNDLYYPDSGNPYLEPEEGSSWEIGLVLGKNESKAQTKLTFFRSEIEDLIEFGFPNMNVARARNEGLELSFVWSVTDAWQLRGSYAYLNAANLTTSEGFLDRRPKHSGSIGLEHSEESTVVGAEMVFRGDTREKDFSLWPAPWVNADDYAVARLYAEHELKDDLSLFGRIENLFDEEYEEVNGYPALGIGAFGGLRYSF